ncbi:hypothetical protein NQ315_009263, partial [Exocentrus adspersus]
KKLWKTNYLVAIVGFFFIFLGVESLIQDRLKSDFFQIYKHAAVETRELQDRPVTPENVTYYLFTKNNPDEYIELNESNLDLLNDRKIVFFVHGWTGSREADWYEDLKDAFLTSYPDYYVVQVDWREPADQLYYVSSINTYEVAKIISKLILELHQHHNVDLNQILLIGHSLGAHVVGFIGEEIYRQTGEKLPRIIALDPAGPLFSTRPEDKRLNKDDAKVVEVIHTDGGTFGYNDAIGTVDFFANGGSSQPGCKRIDLLDLKSVAEPITCDHQRSHQYFIEAILNPKEFTARSCSDWDSYENGKCERGEEVKLGDLTTLATGNFYLETNKEKPYAKRTSNEGGLTSKLLKVLGG